MSSKTARAEGVSTRWWWRIGRRAVPHGPRLALVVITMGTGIALDALRPWPLKWLVDHVFGSNDWPPSLRWIGALPGADSRAGILAWLAAATVLLVAVRRSVEIAQSYLQAGVGTRLVYDFGGELFAHLQRLSLGYHAGQRSGDLVRRVTEDAGAVRDLTLGLGLPLLTSIVSLAVYATVLWRLDPQLTVIALAVVVPLLWLMRRFRQPMAARADAQQRLEGELQAEAERSLSGVALVQAFSTADRENDRFRSLGAATVQAHQRVALLDLLFRLATGAVTALATAGLMLLGGHHVLDGRLSMGGLLVFLAYLASLFGPIETLAQMTSTVASAGAKARRVLEALDSDELVTERPSAPALTACAVGPIGQIELSGVEFGYRPGQAVLHDIDLTVPAGSTVALVGPTGAGKSTLMSLLPRLADPWQGTVRIGQVDIREISLQSLREQIGIVLQDPFLLPLSVADNIAYGRPTASHEQIIAAAVAAQADSFIRALPEGYQTRVGERGARLSGGQRQRLAIARALLKNAPILLLDEPSSALDATTEAELLAALDRLQAGRTTLVIAHRWATVRSADQIVVLEQGRVVESGPPSELVQPGGRYYRLMESQLGSTTRDEAGKSATDRPSRHAWRASRCQYIARRSGPSSSGGD